MEDLELKSSSLGSVLQAVISSLCRFFFLTSTRRSSNRPMVGWGKVLSQTKPTKDNIAKVWLLRIVDVIWLILI